MTDGKPQKHPHRIDEPTREHLTNLLQSIDGLADILCDGSNPRPGSEFEQEQGILAIRSPRDVTTVVGLNALDHLRLAAEHVLNTSRITTFATFTLVRSAITAAGLAGWLMTPHDSKTRLTRTLNLTFHELKNARTAARELDGHLKPDVPENASYNSRLKSAHAMIDKLSNQIECVKDDAVKIGAAEDHSKESLKCISEKPTDTEIVKEAAKLISPDLEYYHDFSTQKEAVQVWRTMSAHAHGLSWAAELTAITETGKDGSTQITWNPEAEDLLQGIQVAWDLMYGAFERYIALLGAGGPPGSG